MIPEWEQCSPWFDHIMASTGFVKPAGNSAEESLTDLLPEFQDAVKEAMPFYKKLNEVRRTPDEYRRNGF